MAKLDEVDMKILAELVKNSSLSVPKLSRKINVNASVVYSRIKRLVKRDLVKKFTVEVNEEMLGYNVAALIGLNIDAKLRDDILEQLMKLEGIRDISEVTGRFDLLLSTKAKSLDDLHGMISNRVGKVPGVVHSETFIEMKKSSREPRYTLPKALAAARVPARRS